MHPTRCQYCNAAGISGDDGIKVDVLVDVLAGANYARYVILVVFVRMVQHLPGYTPIPASIK